MSAAGEPSACSAWRLTPVEESSLAVAIWSNSSPPATASVAPRKRYRRGKLAVILERSDIRDVSTNTYGGWIAGVLSKWQFSIFLSQALRYAIGASKTAAPRTHVQRLFHI